MATSVSVICEGYFKSLNGISVSNSTPVVSVTLCHGSNGAEFDRLSGQKLETKEDLHPFDEGIKWSPMCYWQSDATNDHLTALFLKQGELLWRLERTTLMT
jgi:hypothetical protein